MLIMCLPATCYTSLLDCYVYLCVTVTHVSAYLTLNPATMR